MTSNLVVAETHQLTYHRLGFQAARDWLGLLADFNVRYQTSEEHQRTEQVLRFSHRPPPLLHRCSVYRDDGGCIAGNGSSPFDSDFALAGFSLFPGQTLSPGRVR